MDQELSFRSAERNDVSKIFFFIRKMAEYEKLTSEVKADEKSLEEWIFDKEACEVLFLVLEGKEIGFALFFQNFSTFMGRGGLYLEDIFILPEYRHRGYGKKTFHKLASLAKERGYGRMEWTCLDWNENSIAFYRSLGAFPMSEWTNYRLTREGIEALAKED